MLIYIIPNTTAESRGIAITNIKAAFTLIVKAIIIEPNTTKGERRKSLKVMFTPF